MKTYNHYILENNRSDTKPLTMEEFDYLLNKHCSEFSFDDKPIYRGVELQDDYYKIEPQNYTRKAARSGNFFNVITSNSPLWSHIPSREKSIICTVETSMARSYSGDGNIYRVIPFNNSKWGISHRWFKMYMSDMNLFFNLMNFNDAITDIFNEDIDDENYENMMAKFKSLSVDSLDEYIQKNKFSKYSKQDAMIMLPIKNIMISDNTTFDQAVLKFLEPNQNIDVMPYKNMIKTDFKYETSEVWTNSICLLKKTHKK